MPVAEASAALRQGFVLLPEYDLTVIVPDLEFLRPIETRRNKGLVYYAHPSFTNKNFSLPADLVAGSTVSIRFYRMSDRTLREALLFTDDKKGLLLGAAGIGLLLRAPGMDLLPKDTEYPMVTRLSHSFEGHVPVLRRDGLGDFMVKLASLDEGQPARESFLPMFSRIA